MRCEKKALQEYLHPEEYKGRDTLRIYLWVGTAVHAMCNNEEMPDFPDERYVSFDKITPTRSSAEKAAVKISQRINEAIEQNDIKMVKREYKTPGKIRMSHWAEDIYMEGTIDLMGRIGDDYRKIILDIKTGTTIYPAWLQLGAYAAIDDAVTETKTDVLSVVHMSRKSLSLPEAEPTVLFNDASECKNEAIVVANRVAVLIEGNEAPTASPGNQCQSCTIECPVRAHNYIMR